jgi:hypothetical protein
MKVLSVCFAQAVRLPNNKNETFIAADSYTELSWDKNLSAVLVKMKDINKQVIVFNTNIAYLAKAEDKSEK